MLTPAGGEFVSRRARTREGGTGAETGASVEAGLFCVRIGLFCLHSRSRLTRVRTWGIRWRRRSRGGRSGGGEPGEGEGEGDGLQRSRSLLRVYRSLLPVGKKGKGTVFSKISQVSEHELRPPDDGVRELVT